MAIEFYDSLNVDSNDDSYFLGELGVGTTSPGAKLDVVGDVRASEGSDYTSLSTSGGDTIFSNVSSGSNNIRIFNGGSERMRITSSGSVGIGITNPGAKLDVDGDVLIKSGEYLSWGSEGVTSIEGSTVSNKLSFRTESAERLLLNSTGATFAGNVFLPDNKYATFGGANNAWELQIGVVGDNAFIEKTATTNGDLFIKNNGSGKGIIFQNGGATALTIDSSQNATFAGDVVISKSEPSLKFDNLSGGGLDPTLTADGSNFTISTSSVTPLTLALDTGNATFAGRVYSNTYFESTDNAVVLAPSEAGTVYLRPNGADTGAGAFSLNSSGNGTFSGDVSMVGGNSTGKFAVGTSSVHPSFDFYNQGTAYFNGAVTVDDTLDLVNLKVSGTQGTDGQVLTSTGAGVAWEDASGGSGTVTSIVAGTGLTGGTITTSGTIALDYAGNDNFILASGAQLTSADDQDSLAIVDVSDLRTVKYIQKEDFLEDQVTSVTTGEPSGSDSVINIVSLTQAEYDAGTPVATTLYIIT